MITEIIRRGWGGRFLIATPFLMNQAIYSSSPHPILNLTAWRSLFADPHCGVSMSPAGEIRQALIQAAREVVAELGEPHREATLAGLADRSCVGRDAAR